MNSMDKILTLYRAPRRRGHLEQATHRASIQGKTCGDQLQLDLLVKQGRVCQAAFNGACCAVTTALAECLLEHIEGQPLEVCRHVSTQQMLDNLSIKLPAGRWECADLPRQALLAALKLEL